MEDVADGCYTEVGNASPHKHIHGREFLISFKVGHIILPVQPVSEFHNVQGHDPPQAFAFGSRESPYISEYL